MTKRILLYFLFALVSLNFFSAQSQEDSLLIKNDALNERSLTLKKDTIRVVDSLTPISTERDLPVILVKTTLKDSLIFNLKDRAYSARVDSLWLEELTNAYLFDSINNIVQNLDYDNEDFEMPELPTDTLKKRLANLNSRTPFNIEYNPSLESVIKMYLRRHRPTMERLMGLSEFYFPTFEETLDKYDMPLELKYLAIVESALRPRAKSRVGATGMWQFMYATGKMYGLDVSSYVDERMDPIMSTEAASKYLSKLYEMFGDWDLALASYNSGPGNVSKAIRRSGGHKNYWNLRHHLPRETAGYVPAFLATMYIFEYAEEHGYNPKRPDFNYFETDTVKIKQTITLDQVAKYTNTPIEEIEFLNPSYKLDVIPYIEDENYYLRLPVTTIGKFVANEEAIYATATKEFESKEKTLPQYFETDSRVTYRVRSGDYLGKIAERYGVGISQIKRWNNLRSNSLHIGQRLLIYPKKPVASVSRKTSTKKAVAANAKTYVVREGDSLWKIAKKFPGVSPENLKVWNDISGNKLKPGMTLVVSN